MPHEIGAATTVYDRFRAWEQDGFFERLWVAGMSEFDELVGIDWEWSGKAWMERCLKPLSPAPRPHQRKASATIRRIAANTASSAAPLLPAV